MKGPDGRYAWTVTVGAKGQIVIPSEARKLFGISPGDTLILLGDPEWGMAIPPASALGEFTEKIFGSVMKDVSAK